MTKAQLEARIKELIAKCDATSNELHDVRREHETLKRLSRGVVADFAKARQHIRILEAVVHYYTSDQSGGNQ